MGYKAIEIERKLPPRDFSLEIKSFSKLARACNTPETAMYESIIFRAQGYSWQLQLYPNGNPAKSNEEDHISLYLAIVDLPSDENVNVEIKFSVYNSDKDTYLMIQDAKAKRFYEGKTERGSDRVMSLDVFNDRANGYLVNDYCEFGVEILVLSKTTAKRQTLDNIEPTLTLAPFKRTFKGFSKMDKNFYYADPPIKFGDQMWKLKIYPEGSGRQKGNSLSIFLELVNVSKLEPGKQVWAEYKLRVLDQRQDKHVTKSISRWFSSSNTDAWGFPKFVPLDDLHKKRSGFVMDDNLIVEVEFINVSTTEISP